MFKASGSQSQGLAPDVRVSVFGFWLGLGLGMKIRVLASWNPITFNRLR